MKEATPVQTQILIDGVSPGYGVIGMIIPVAIIISHRDRVGCQNALTIIMQLDLVNCPRDSVKKENEI